MRIVRIATDRFARSKVSEPWISSRVDFARPRIAAFFSSQSLNRCSGLEAPSPAASTSAVSAACAANRSSRIDARAIDCHRSSRGSSMIRSIRSVIRSRSARS